MKPPPAPPAPTPAQQITGSTDTEEDAGPVPGMDEWKDTYDKYVSDWQAESSLARQKAEDTRKQIEAEHAAIAKKMEDIKKSEKKAEAEKKRQQERDEKLKRELAEEKASGMGKRRADLTGQDKQKVKEAWEFIKSGDEGPKPKDTVADVRGVMPQDVKAGNVHAKSEKANDVSAKSAIRGTVTLNMQSSIDNAEGSPTLPPPEASQTLSQSATSQAWTEVSGNTSSAEDLSPPQYGSSDEASAPTTNEKPKTQSQSQSQSNSGVPARISENQNRSGPPSQPPSLTLSMFTSPSNLSISKVLAIVGINLVLPFVNGVMLGFGEIFAREAVRTGRFWWRNGISLFGRGSGGRGTSGVGLSGSGGF